MQDCSTPITPTPPVEEQRPLTDSPWAYSQPTTAEKRRQRRQNHRAGLTPEAAHRERVACIRQSRRRYRKRLALVQTLKAERGCYECGYSYNPYALDFHHRDPDGKALNIAQAIHLSSDRLMAEIAKCDVLCSNCHRIRGIGRVAPTRVDIDVAPLPVAEVRPLIHDGKELSPSAWEEETGIPSSRIRRRRLGGWSDERNLTTPVGKNPGIPAVEVTYKGVTKTTAVWAKELNIPQPVIYKRWWLGWKAEKIIETPYRERGKTLTRNGETHTVKEWSVITGIGVATLNQRIRNEWTDEEVLTLPVRQANNQYTRKKQPEMSSLFSEEDDPEE